MKYLIEHFFAKSYNSTKNIVVEERIEKGNFGTNDEKSCKDCQEQFKLSCRDKINSYHKSEQDIHIIRLEDVFQEFKNIPAISKDGCCDLLMYSEDKIAVMEMTCSKPQYIEPHIVNGKQKQGKRAHAYQQMYDSIKKLRHCDEINTKIDSYNDRVAIFSVRKKTSAEESSNAVAKQMNNFSKLSKQVSWMNYRTDMGNGFYFIIQEYNNEYQW